MSEGAYGRVNITYPTATTDVGHTITFPAPSAETYTHAVIGGDTELVIHEDGSSELRTTGHVIDLQRPHELGGTP